MSRGVKRTANGREKYVKFWFENTRGRITWVTYLRVLLEIPYKKCFMKMRTRLNYVKIGSS